jgi:predicted ATPase
MTQLRSRDFSPWRSLALARYAGVVPIPDALATALLRRLRRLNRAERSVLMRASVIGQRFRVAVLTATTTLSEDRVLAVLEAASALQFVVRESGRSDWYSFRHALIRDVAYREFVATQLRPIHRRIARALERCAEANEKALDDLAYHAWSAQDASRCIRYNELAGDRAAAAFANRDAQVYYGRALEFARVDSKQYRQLSSKLVELHNDGPESPGAQTPESQSTPEGDRSTRPVPAVCRTPG